MRSGFLILTILGAVGFYYLGSDRPQEVELKRSKSSAVRRVSQPPSVNQVPATSPSEMADSPALRLPTIRNPEELNGNSRIYEPTDENEILSKEPMALAGKPAGKLLGLVGKSTEEEIPFDEAFLEDETLVDEFKNGNAPVGQRFGNGYLDSEFPDDSKPDVQARAAPTWKDPDQDPPEESEVESD